MTSMEKHALCLVFFTNIGLETYSSAYIIYYILQYVHIETIYFMD